MAVSQAGSEHAKLSRPKRTTKFSALLSAHQVAALIRAPPVHLCRSGSQAGRLELDALDLRERSVLWGDVRVGRLCPEVVCLFKGSPVTVQAEGLWLLSFGQNHSTLVFASTAAAAVFFTIRLPMDAQTPLEQLHSPVADLGPCLEFLNHRLSLLRVGRCLVVELFREGPELLNLLRMERQLRLLGPFAFFQSHYLALTLGSLSPALLRLFNLCNRPLCLDDGCLHNPMLMCDGLKILFPCGKKLICFFLKGLFGDLRDLQHFGVLSCLVHCSPSTSSSRKEL
mmetsp:Transcript_35999/g.70833  ORF Transcript_35999/g.70833 Transcript_35999/m.70833 type:complete len:283 (-) Transcript_35999:231-1079(-)